MSLTAAAFPQSANQAAEIKKHLQAGQQFLAQRKLEEAAREFSAVAELNPRNVEAHANLGVIEFLRGNCGEATPRFQTSLRLNPQLWNVYALLGFCEFRQGDGTRGREHLEKAFPKLTDSKLRIQAGLFLIQFYRQTGEVERATSTMTRLQQLDGDDVDVQYSAYRLYSDLADQAVTAVSVNHGDSARLRQIVAQRLVETGNLEAAIKAYREALKIDPHLTGAHFELGEALLRNSSSATPADQLEEARKELETAVAEDRHDAQAECLLGELSLRGSDEKDAKQHLLKALAIQPQNPDAHLGMGKVYVLDGDLEKALNEFKNVIRQDPANAQAHYVLAQTYRKLGQLKDAEQEVATYRALRSSQRQLEDMFGRMRKDISAEDPSDEEPKSNNN